MPSRRRILLLSALLSAAPGPLFAEEGPDEPRAPGSEPRPAPSTIPDASLRAVKDRRVTLETGRGSVTGKLIAFEADAVTLVLGDGNVVTVARAQIVTLRLADLAPAAPSAGNDSSNQEPAVPEAPEKPRHFGLHIGLSPGIAVDVEYGRFYGFASTSPLFPLASSGQIFGFAVGAGVAIALSKHWHFDIYGTVSPLWWTGLSGYNQQTTLIGLGVGMGVHYTSSGGWCFGLKLPLLGAAPALNYNSYNTFSSYNLGLATAMFYMSNVVSLPILSFGYRF